MSEPQQGPAPVVPPSVRPRRLRTTISTDDLEFFRVEEGDVFDTIAILNGGRTVGYSHRGGGRQPRPDISARP